MKVGGCIEKEIRFIVYSLLFLKNIDVYKKSLNICIFRLYIIVIYII